MLPTAEIMFGSFIEQQDAQTQDQSPEVADPHRDTPGRRIGDALGTKVNDIRKEDTKGYE